MIFCFAACPICLFTVAPMTAAFGIQPELEPLLVQMQALQVEKLEGMTEVIFDWTQVSDLAEWLRLQLAEFH